MTVNKIMYCNIHLRFAAQAKFIIAASGLGLLVAGCGGGGSSSQTPAGTKDPVVNQESPVLGEDNYAVYASAVFKSSTQLLSAHGLMGLPFASAVNSPGRDETEQQACISGGEKVVRAVQAVDNVVSVGDRLTTTYRACAENAAVAGGVIQTTEGTREIEVVECVNCTGVGSYDKFALRTVSDVIKVFAVGGGVSTQTQGDMSLVIEGNHTALASSRYETGGEVLEALTFAAFGTETWTWDYKRVNDGVTIKTVEIFQFPPNVSYFDAAALEGRMDILFDDGRQISVQVLPDSNGLTEITYQGQKQTLGWTDFAKLALNAAVPTVKVPNT